MNCRQCEAELAEPGDYCLRCHTRNTDAVVVEITSITATITMFADANPIGSTTITTREETESAKQSVRKRNFIGRICDTVQRKRPDTVYINGDHAFIRRVKEELHYEISVIDHENPVDHAITLMSGNNIPSADLSPKEKIGGAHSTLIGGKDGHRAIRTVANHPHIKKIIPGPIDSSGRSNSQGVHAKVTRSDNNGNLRLLVRDGSAVQENRLITTASQRERGSRIQTALNEKLVNVGLHET
ncbi:MAG: DUF2103 domain-containing protein [Halobacteriaceae archaeon]